MYLIANAYTEALPFELPRGVAWKAVVDTSLDPPHDLAEESDAPNWSSPSYQVGPRSVVILVEAEP